MREGGRKRGREEGREGGREREREGGREREVVKGYRGMMEACWEREVVMTSE